MRGQTSIFCLFLLIIMTMAHFLKQNIFTSKTILETNFDDIFKWSIQMFRAVLVPICSNYELQKEIEYLGVIELWMVTMNNFLVHSLISTTSSYYFICIWNYRSSASVSQLKSVSHRSLQFCSYKINQCFYKTVKTQQ